MNYIQERFSINLHTISVMFALTLITGCSSGGQPQSHQSLLISETPISNNSSRITIKSDLRLYPASVFSMMTMCKCVRITMDRGFRYFYTDEKTRGAQPDGQPSFRITFYKSTPEGMKVYPAEGVSILSREAGSSMDGFDPDSMVIDAEGFEPACKLFYQQLKQVN